VPASEQYHRVVPDNSEPGRNDVFLTGVPGAGKTTYVLRGGEVPQNVRVASVQGRLLEGLRAIHERFGDAVELRIFDRRGTIAKEVRGWDHLSVLQSEGTYEQIKHNLTGILDREHRVGRLSEPAYEQALGKAPRGIYRGVAQESAGSFERSNQAPAAS